MKNFPDFRKLKLHDFESIRSLTNRQSLYSDFNPTSLWAWNTSDDLQISRLNDNIIILMPDYTSNDKILTVIGKKSPARTVSALQRYAEQSQQKISIKLLAREVAQALKYRNTYIATDRDNFDYIFSTKQLSELTGKRFKSKRRLAEGFVSENPNCTFSTQPLSKVTITKDLLIALESWIKEDREDYETELIAIRRVLDLPIKYKERLKFSSIHDDGILIAFCIDEILSQTYALSHFIKVNKQYSGVTEYLNKKTAEHLRDQKIRYWNWEQDLGVPGLRNSKESYRPLFKLKKYSINL